jgi:predicted small lipoprotein YifL
MARQTEAAVILALALGLALTGCGRKGPLDPPGTQNSKPVPAEAEKSEQPAKP